LIGVAAAVNSWCSWSCLRFRQQLDWRTIPPPPLGKLEAAASEVNESDSFHGIPRDPFEESDDRCWLQHGLPKQDHPNYVDKESYGSCGCYH
jgi:hypothetical protein